MSQIKLLLDIISDIRSLTDSLEAYFMNSPVPDAAGISQHTAIKKENIVHMNAILKGDFIMTEQQFEAEKKYQVSKAIALSLFRSGIINEEEYLQIDTILLQKYAPLLGSLFAENNLQLC